MQRLPAITHDRFSLFRFRSPLLTESRLLSLPVGTEMFHFPTFPPLALCVQARVTGLASSRVSPFGNPRITVWLSTPRGLSQIPTSFFGSWCQGIHRVPLKTWPQRCSRPLCSSQETGGPTRPGAYHTPRTLTRDTAVRPWMRTNRSTGPEAPGKRPIPQDPTTCQAPPRPDRLSTPPEGGCTHQAGATTTPNNRCSTLEQPLRNDRPKQAPGSPKRPVLLRKEVIQPHLPVRLPCYDLVPIASPTFDSSPPKGLGHRLRVLPTFVT
jgi:hypothetical protein